MKIYTKIDGSLAVFNVDNAKTWQDAIKIVRDSLQNQYKKNTILALIK